MGKQDEDLYKQIGSDRYDPHLDIDLNEFITDLQGHKGRGATKMVLKSDPRNTDVIFCFEKPVTIAEDKQRRVKLLQDQIDKINAE